MKTNKLIKLSKEITKKLDTYADKSFSGKVVFEVNFSDGGINSAKVKEEEVMRF